jgi:UDP-N-acetyl-D-mannosaminuronic acid dehydrogenase
MNTEQSIIPGTVAVVGAGGHIGLPLSVVIADSGLSVTGIDRSNDVIERLNNGHVPYVEHGAEELLQKTLRDGTLSFTTDTSSLRTSEVVVVIIGTPIDDNLNPRIEPLLELLETHARVMPQGQVIVLRSTVSPGTTELVRGALEEGSGKVEGEDFFLVFAPERVLQTMAVREIRSLPQIVGAFSPLGFAKAESFFSQFMDNVCIKVTPVEAELGKLITNMTRYVSFAMANEFYMICDTYGADSYRIIEACNQDYPRLDLPRPGPNVGGPCLYKDGYYLTENLWSPDLIATAFKINESMPRFLLNKVRAQRDLKRVGVLGLTFKANCDDTRNSLSFKLIKQIRSMRATPVSVDPYLSEYADDTRLRGVDALIVMTPHDEFRDLGRLLSIIDNPDCVIIDMWNLWPSMASLSSERCYLAKDAAELLARQPRSVIDLRDPADLPVQDLSADVDVTGDRESAIG